MSGHLPTSREGADGSAGGAGSSGSALSSYYGGGLSTESLLSLGSMEGIVAPAVSLVPPAEKAPPKADSLVPGYALAGVVAAAAHGIHYLPFAPFTVVSQGVTRHPVSAAIMAILIGLVVRNTMAVPAAINLGCKHIIKRVIPLVIVCMGARLDLLDLAGIKIYALLITVACIFVALAAGYYAGRLFGLSSKTSLLLGAGTGICGNSAIVAVAPLLKAEDDEVALSVGTVNLVGLLAMLSWPLLGEALTMSEAAYGVWAGTSIHAVPQVVAAGFAIGPDAGTLATLVKLVRVSSMAPLLLVLAILYSRRAMASAAALGSIEGVEMERVRVNYAKFVPWFIWGFMGLALLNTLGLIPTLQFPTTGLFSGSPASPEVSIPAVFTSTGKLFLALSLAAIGLEVNVRHLMSVGIKAIMAGVVSTAVLGAISLGLIHLLM